MYYVSLVNFSLALPIAVMLGAIMTFGNMGEHFELTAAKSAGISLYRIMSPIFIIAILFTIISFLFANYIMPYGTLKTYTLIASIRQKHPALRIQEGIFNYDVQGYVIRVGKKNNKNGMMYDFMIYDHKNYNGNKFVITADSGTLEVTDDLKYMIIKLYDGSQYEELKETSTDPQKPQYPYHQDLFKKQTIIIPLKGFNLQKTSMTLFAQNYNMLNVRQLKQKIDSLQTRLDSKIDYYYNVIEQNDILKYQIKLRTNTDSVNFLAAIKHLNRISPDSLKVIFDIDSAISIQPLTTQKNIIKTALTNAKNLSNRVQIFQAEYKARKDWLVQHKIAFHKKFVFSLACFLFFFIGAPLGAIIRKGGFGLPTIISVILFLIFYVLVTLGEKIARDGSISAFWGIWFPVFIYLPFEIYIFYKASTDSAIFNWDYIIEIIKKYTKKYTPNFLLPPRYRKIRQRQINAAKNNKQK
jgi:lipopolysaccharide export system permease protein